MSDYTDQPRETDHLVAGSQARTFMGHPIGLPVLFFTEMWERFSFYGMRGLLILYLTEHFMFSAPKASLIFGAYIALTYFLPVLGGYFADRYLGSRKAVVFGGLLLVAGHSMLAFEGPPASIVDGNVVRSDLHVSIFYFSLALIITGVGFLKANISTIVGSLYGEQDPRRDGGFTLFYMGINVGSFLAFLIVGGVGQTYGWNYGFGLAGIGMLLGLLVFLWGQKYLEGRADPPNPADLQSPAFGPITKEWAVYLTGFVLVGVMYLAVQYQELLGGLVNGTGSIMLLALVAYAFVKCTPEERDRLLVACFLFFSMIVFWALFEQQGASLTLLADQQFSLDFGLFTLLPSQVQTLNPFFIMLFAPVLAWLWVKLNGMGLEPNTVAKFGLSLLLMGAGFWLFAYGLEAEEGSNKSVWWLVMIYWFLTMSELCLSPVGLSMVTKLSPQRIVGATMGCFFLFIAMGNWFAGLISSLVGAGDHGGGNSAAISVPATVDLFTQIAIASIALGFVLVLLAKPLKKRMHGVH